MNKSLLYVLALVFSSALLVQCRAKKPLIAEPEVTILTKSKADSIVRNVLDNNFVFENLKAKINTRFKSREKKNLAFGTFIKMFKDSAIFATISVATFPVVVALITPDSLKFINKRDKKYFVGEFSYVSNLLNTEITFAQIQDLLVGNPVYLDSNERHHLVKEDNKVWISTESQSEINERKNSNEISNEWFVKHWINELYKSGKTIISNQEKETRIEFFQADYKKVDGQLFPNRTKAEIITPKDSVFINLNYQRVKINSNLSFTFSIPNHYTPYSNEK